MMSATHLHHLRRGLEGPLSQPIWPAGFAIRRFNPGPDAFAVHQLLEAAYATGGGSVASFEPWWNSLSNDDEYDPELVFTVFDQAGELAGVALCWTTAFVKDLAVARDHRRKGLAMALLRHAFLTFCERGEPAVDLKVETGNLGAIALYRSAGMEAVRCS